MHSLLSNRQNAGVFLSIVGVLVIMAGIAPLAFAQSGAGILFQDDFGSDTGAWRTGPRDTGDRVIAGGSLRITDLPLTYSTTSYLDDQTFTDLTIELDTTLLSGDDRGWHMVLLRYQDSENFHGFAFTATGRVNGFTILNGERIRWQESITHPAIRTGFGQVNHVRIEADGPTLRFYINGELVTQTEQPGPAEAGKVALSVSAPSGDDAIQETVVAFDNVVIRGAGSDQPTKILNSAASGDTLRVSARCEEISVPPPTITTTDNVQVRWTWTTRDPAYLDQHRAAVNYMVLLDGMPLDYGDPVYETTDAGDYTIHALAWHVDVGPLAPGQHRVDYFATWNTAISTGRAEYGPGTDNPRHVGGCSFEVMQGESIAAESAAGQPDLARLEALDYEAIAASNLPPINPDRIQQAGNNGTGLPALLSYAFEPEEVAPGVFVDATATWSLTDSTVQPALVWEIRSDAGSTGTVEYIVDIPKEFASTVADIKFSVPPDEIIQDDPIIKWFIDLSNVINRRIEARSMTMMALSGLDDPIALLQTFENQLEDINLRRQFQSCQRMTGPTSELDAAVCALSVIMQNRERFTLDICNSFPTVTTEGNTRTDAVFIDACRNLLQPVDNLHCNAIEDTGERDACLILTRNVLASSCAGLSGFERDMCLYDVAVFSEQPRGCEAIADADMGQDCRAQISGDPAYCDAITDPTRHDACCAIFEGNADLYTACLGEQLAEGGEVIEEGETLTLGEVLGSEGSGEDTGQDSAFGPLPAAPDLGYLMNDAFYAEYTCEGEDEVVRFVAADGQFFYSQDTEHGLPLPPNLISTLSEGNPDGMAGGSLFYLGAPGLWMSLDGSIYSTPAVTEPWATDAESFDRYSALDLRPTPDTLTIAGATLDVTRYQGSYTEETVIDNRDSTFVDGYFSDMVQNSFDAWYEQRTGLLVRSHFQRVIIDCYKEGDYADYECPTAIELSCTLSDTSLPLGR